MITFASILFLAQFRVGQRWLIWPIPLALALSAATAQFVALTGIAGIRLTGLILLVMAILAWVVRSLQHAETPLRVWFCKARDENGRVLNYLKQGGATGKTAVVFLVVFSAALIAWGVLYLPMPLDDYNAIHAELIARHDSLNIGPTLNWTISALGFLHEYIIADLSLIPGIGNILPMFLPWLIWTAFAFVILSYASRNDTDRRVLPVWAALAALPLIIWSVTSLYKNDLLTAALSFPPLWMLAARENTDDPETQLLMGLFAGLAAATKLSAAVVVVALLCLLPVRGIATFISGRARVGLGALVGMFCGGLAFVYYRNWLLFGNVFGFLDSTHLATGALHDRIAGALRFINSILNPVEIFLIPLNVFPNFLPQFHPITDLSLSRLSLSALFAASLLAYGYELFRGRARAWPGIVSFSVIFITALLNRDLDMTHRYIIAPSMLLMLEAARSVSCDVSVGTNARRGEFVVRLYSIFAIFVLFQSIATIALLFDKTEFIRERSGWYGTLATSIENRLGLTKLRSQTIMAKLLYMREINDAAQHSRHVANGAFEYHVDLRGIPYEQIYALRRVGPGARAEWNLDDLDKFDLIIIDDELSVPERLLAWLKDRCVLMGPSAGRNLPKEPSIRGYRCS